MDTTMTSPSTRLALTVGPVLYHWSREALMQFYADVAESPADTVVLGETVCARRRELRLEDWLLLARALAGAGKEVVLAAQALVETEADQTMLVHGSYHATFRLYDKLIVTDKETYNYDILAGTLKTEAGSVPIEAEQKNCARVIVDFLAAVRGGRPPVTHGPTVLPAMRVLQAVQDEWDKHYGVQAIPGRPL